MTTVRMPKGVDVEAELKRAKREMLRRTVCRSFRRFLPFWKFKDRDTGVIRSFDDETLWEGQQEFRDAAEEYNWLLALKAGKLGLTELECAFDGWRLLGSRNGRVHVFSRDATAAEKLLEYIRFGLTHLPEWLRPELLVDERGGDTGHSIKIRMGRDDVRTVERFAAGPNVSIDTSCNHAHVDELGAMPHAQQTWSAVSSTVAPDGTCHVVSRGYGEDVYLTELWQAAEAGASELYPLFSDWTKRPGRDEAWFRREEAKNPHGIRFLAPEKPEDCLSGEATQDFVPIELWDQCEAARQGVPLPRFVTAEGGVPENVRRIPVVLSLDAAEGRSGVGDTFGAVLVMRHPNRHTDGVAIVATRNWEAPFEFPEIDAWVRTVCHSYNVIMIAYDPFQLVDMMQRVNREVGVPIKRFDQGKRRAMADRLLYDLIIQKRIVHTGDPALREHVGNCRAKLQPGEDSKLRMIKKAPHRKIDLAVAMSMGAFQCLKLLL